jgi:hypothetical protein
LIKLKKGSPPPDVMTSNIAPTQYVEEINLQMMKKQTPMREVESPRNNNSLDTNHSRLPQTSDPKPYRTK